MKKLFAGILALVGVAGIIAGTAMPAMAAGQCGDTGVETSILGSGGCYNESEDGDGVYYVLNIILTILTFGVGIAGTIGLVIVGIMYASAGPNEAQVAKAKKRILEIVIGLVVYAVMYLALQWLLPGGIF